MAKTWLRPLLLAMLLVASAGFLWVNPEFVSNFRTWLISNQDIAIASLGILLLFFMLTQLLVLPSGTAILLITGAILGPVSGMLYFLAMIVVTPITFLMAKTHPEKAQRALRRWASHPRFRAILASGLDSMQAKPVIGTGMLRLLPVLPSAPAVLIAAAFGLSLRGILIGTALFGFIRPMAISTIGYALSTLSLTTERGQDSTVLLILIASLASLAASLGMLRYLIWAGATETEAPKPDR